MDLGRRERPQRDRAAPHAAAHDQRAFFLRADAESPMAVGAIQSFAGHPQRKAPRQDDLPTVGVAAQREIERPIPDGLERVG